MYAEVSAIRYPISTALCIAAIGAIAALFVLARPQYHPQSGKTIDLSGYAPPVEIPDPDAVRRAIVVPDVPEEVPAARTILDDFLREPLDPWDLPVSW